MGILEIVGRYGTCTPNVAFKVSGRTELTLQSGVSAEKLPRFTPEKPDDKSKQLRVDTDASTPTFDA